MRYFYVPPGQIYGNQVRILGRELHHIVDVIRLREGDEISVLDGSGGIYEVVLMSCARDVGVGEIRTCRQVQPPLVEVTLFVGLPKADKMDMIVQKATELGAHRIVPVLCQHTVHYVRTEPRLPADRAQRRVARWRQIAVEASKQSRRPFFPSVSHVLCFDEALEEPHADIRLIFTTRVPLINSSQSATRHSAVPNRFRDVLKQNTRARKVELFIGPEGGFSKNEICHAMSAGAVPISLGSNILRTETAAIAALTIVLYEKDAIYNSSLPRAETGITTQT